MTAPVISIADARLAFGDRVLWDGLNLDVARGEFIAVLGPNGSGKTSLLKVLTGQLPLSAGSVSIAGQQVTAGSRRVGYIPQHRAIEGGPTLRGADLVRLGADGHRWGATSRRSVRRAREESVRRVLAEVGASHLERRPLDVLSGGELQRLRIAQALACDPDVLLCDEPLLNLDPANARLVSELIDKRRQDADSAVLFVTHEINPVLSFVDRVLYLVDGRFRIGTIDDVMTSRQLSELYRADVDVLRVRGQYVVVGNGGFCHE